MARIELDVDHTLPPEAALARMHALGEYYQSRHAAVVHWAGREGDITVKYLGLKLTVNVRVEDRRVHAEAPDPGFLLRRRGIDYLKRKVARYLDPATPVEQLPRT